MWRRHKGVTADSDTSGLSSLPSAAVPAAGGVSRSCHGDRCDLKRGLSPTGMGSTTRADPAQYTPSWHSCLGEMSPHPHGANQPLLGPAL